MNIYIKQRFNLFAKDVIGRSIAGRHSIYIIYHYCPNVDVLECCNIMSYQIRSIRVGD